jgi:lipoyl synthase
MPRLPEWLRKRVPAASERARVDELLQRMDLATVCQSAHCPNLCECFARGTATFMILGRVCTRSCTFCAVPDGVPAPPDPDEPRRVAEATVDLGLRHVVVTSVTRDDLPDGGSSQFAAVIEAIRQRTGASIEVLTPDFGGCVKDIQTVLDAGPDIFNHNIETVPRLYDAVRPQANFQRSLDVLALAAQHPRVPMTKSGMMLGLGERLDEVIDALRALRDAGCCVLTLGQYLAPSPQHHPVVEFVPPEQFEQYRTEALALGFAAVAAGPFVRSSYNAAEVADEAGLQSPPRTSHIPRGI